MIAKYLLVIFVIDGRDIKLDIYHFLHYSIFFYLIFRTSSSYYVVIIIPNNYVFECIWKGNLEIL